MFAQSEISELFPTLAGLERTIFISYWEDCGGKSESIHITSPIEIDTINGKPYLFRDGFFLREENNQVLIYSFAYEDDLVLYDWSLEIGDSLSLLALDQYSFSNIVLAILEIGFLIYGTIFVGQIDAMHFWYIILGVCGYDIFAYLFGTYEYPP